MSYDEIGKLRRDLEDFRYQAECDKMKKEILREYEGWGLEDAKKDILQRINDGKKGSKMKPTKGETKMKLFEYVIYTKPTYDPMKTKEEQEMPVVLVPVTAVIAETEGDVLALAGRQIPAEWTKRMSEVEVAIRPFN